MISFQMERKIRALAEDGHAESEIAEICQVSRNTVTRAILRPRSKGDEITIDIKPCKPYFCGGCRTMVRQRPCLACALRALRDRHTVMA